MKGKYAEAERFSSRACELEKMQAGGKKTPILAKYLTDLAAIKLNLPDKNDEADNNLKFAIDFIKSLLNDQHVFICQPYLY